MKTLIIILSMFLAISTAASAQVATKSTKNEIQKTTYVCPMHPKEVSLKEGECSKCGMELVKTKQLKPNTAIKGSQTMNAVKTKYVCKMDGQTSEKAGKCPKCGMAMTLKESDKKDVHHQY